MYVCVQCTPFLTMQREKERDALSMKIVYQIHGHSSPQLGPDENHLESTPTTLRNL